MQRLVASWGIALGQTFIVEEPALILLSHVVPGALRKVRGSAICLKVTAVVSASGVGRFMNGCLVCVLSGGATLFGN